jgi:hypothetical protein
MKINAITLEIHCKNKSAYIKPKNRPHRAAYGPKNMVKIFPCHGSILPLGTMI